MFAFCEPNFQILERKLFFDFKNPYKIVVNAEPERSEGEVNLTQNSKIVNRRKGWDSNPRAPLGGAALQAAAVDHFATLPTTLY